MRPRRPIWADPLGVQVAAMAALWTLIILLLGTAP